VKLETREQMLRESVRAFERWRGVPAPQRGAREILAVLLLLTGFPPFLGWFVGLGLLVASPLWTVRQKWLGALVWPGGLLVVFFGGGLLAVGLGSISQGPIALALAAAPVFVAAYLYRAAGRNSANA